VSWVTLAAIYVLIWWIVLFGVLPWGVRSQTESGDVGPGTEPGAPAVSRLKAKLLWTTLVASLVFAAFLWAYGKGLLRPENFGPLWELGRSAT
jgi:predicted secreted protein